LDSNGAIPVDRIRPGGNIDMAQLAAWHTSPAAAAIMQSVPSAAAMLMDHFAAVYGNGPNNIGVGGASSMNSNNDMSNQQGLQQLQQQQLQQLQQLQQAQAIYYQSQPHPLQQQQSILRQHQQQVQQPIYHYEL
jgi:hypothetical protein